MSQETMQFMHNKDNNSIGREPNVLHLLNVFAANLEEKHLVFSEHIKQNNHLDLQAKIGKFMEAEIIKLLKEKKAKEPQSIASHIELDYSTFKAKKIKQIELVSVTTQIRKNTKTSNENRIIASPLTLIKNERAPLSPIKNFNVSCIDEHSRREGWSLAIERSPEQLPWMDSEIAIHEQSHNLPPSVGQENNFWTSNSNSKKNNQSSSKQNIGFASGKKISKIRDESELTPQKLIGDMVINMPKESSNKFIKKTPEPRSVSPIVDMVKGFFSSGYNYIMGSRSKEKPKPKATPTFKPKQETPTSQKSSIFGMNMYFSDKVSGTASKMAALLTLPPIAERLSDRIVRESKQTRFSEMFIEQKLSEEFAKQGSMDDPHLAIKRVTASLRANNGLYREHETSKTDDLLNKSMIRPANLDDDECTRIKRGSLSRTPFKPLRSVSVEEDTDSKAFLACLNEPCPNLEQVLELRRSESMPVQSSTNASSDLAANLSQNLTPRTESLQTGIQNGFKKSVFGPRDGVFMLPLNEDAQHIRTEQLSLEPSREDENSQFVASTAVKNYFAAAQLNAQTSDRESSIGYELSDGEDTDSDPDHDREEWKDVDKLSDCKTYSQTKHSKMLLDEVKKYCGPGYMQSHSELNPNDHRVKMAYTAMNLTESQFLELLEREKTPQKAHGNLQKKVLFVNNKRVPQWASDKEVVRKTVLAQNAFGHYRTVFRKMKPIKEFNIAEFFPGINPQILKNYHR